MTRVILADDQPLLLEGFRMILEAQGDIEVVATAGDGAAAAERTLALDPDVVVMDVRMPGVDGIEATRRIVAAGARARILVLTTFDLDEYAFGALRAGASGFLLKDVPPAELVGAIRAVADGNAVVAPRITRRLLDAFAERLPANGTTAEGEDPRLAALTAREREVLVELAGGRTNAEIAERLVVSDATVKSHVARILQKLGARDRVQAVIVAYQTGLVRP